VIQETIQQEIGRLTRGAGEPGRSRIAPVAGEEKVDSVETIGGMLQGLGSSAASTALANAAALEKLPAAQKVVLKQALRAALETRNEAEGFKDELARIKGLLQIAEKDLSDKSEGFRMQAEEAESKLAGLAQDLSGAAATSCASESRLRVRTVHLRIALGTALLAITACAFLIVRTGAVLRAPSEAGASSQAVKSLQKETTAVARVVASVVAPDVASAVAQRQGEPVEEALNRLDRALSAIPLARVTEAIDEANRWLKASGSPPCSVPFSGGKTSLVVTPTLGSPGLLASSIVRCARAFEHVVELPGE
jgi:hypothetical protein